MGLLPDPAEAPYELRAQIAREPGAALAVQVLLDYAGPQDHVQVNLGDGTVAIGRIGEDAQPLLEARMEPPPQSHLRHELRVRRSATEIVVALDGIAIARARQPAPAEAKAGAASLAEGCTVDEVRVQSLGEIAFTDDFMRTKDEMGEWVRVFGDWSVASLELPQFSANPFCFAGGGHYAFCTAGHEFWSDYCATAAVRRTAEARCAALAFAVRDRGSFYRFEWITQDGGAFRLVRRRAGEDEVLASSPALLATDQWYELEVVAAGPRVLAGVDRNLVFSLDAAELYGGKIGLWCQGKGPVYFDDLRVFSLDTAPASAQFAEIIPRPQPPVTKAAMGDSFMKVWANRPTKVDHGALLDYTFKRAPVDWLAYTGQWGSMTRWECQPQWTWFGGRGPRSVVVWNKERFEGDVDFECFLAHMKDFAFNPIFCHPGNMCLTICGDGENLDSGYSFVFAGGGNRWSRLYRHNQVVAETDKAVMPDNRDALNIDHQYRNWYGLRVRKTGADLACLVDGKEVLKWQDPKPLPGGKVAVWTFDNSLLLARARIIADGVKPGGAPSAGMTWRPTRRRGSNLRPNDAAPRLLPGSGRQSPPAPSRKRWTFEDDLAGWAARDGEQGAQLALDRGVAGRRGTSLRLINPKSGGTFGATIPLAGVDASRAAIRFDYCVGPAARANLYLKVRGWWYTVVLSAPEAKHWRAPRIGSFADIRADGKWHATSFDLSDALTPEKLVLLPGDSASGPRLIEDAFFGFWSEDVYAMAGFGINPAGATYHLDDFQVLPRRARRPKQDKPTPRRTSTSSALECTAWRNFGGARGMRVLSTPWARADGSRSILLVNEHFGGIAGAAIRDVPFDASQYPRVSFDYKVDSAARLDFQVQLAFGAGEADRWRTVKFTDNDVAWPVIGKCDGIVTDGQWRHCDFDLGAMLKKNGADPTVARLILASGGWPGNEDGLHLWFANFRLLAAADSGEQPADASAPAVAGISPTDGAKSGECRIAAKLTDEGAGVLPASLRLRVAKHWYSLSDRELAYDPKTGTLTWDGLASRPLPTTFADGASVPCRLQVSDRAGNPLADPFEWTWQADHTLDETPPPAPFAAHVPTRAVFREGFEAGDALEFGQWQNADVRLAQAAAATGQGSLLVTDWGADAFTAGIERAPVDPNEYPYVALDFMVDPVPGPTPQYSFYTIQFNGQVGDRFTIGQAPTPTPRQWTHAEFDLRTTMKPGVGPPYFFMIGESGSQSPRPGTRLYVDNFTIYSRASREIGVEWSTPPDASGIDGFSWCFDQQTDTVPDGEGEGADTSTSWTAPGPGTYHFHVRARDGAGNWGRAGHCRIVIE